MSQNYSKEESPIIDGRFIKNLISICGEKFVIIDKDCLLDFEKDETYNFSFSFDILVVPGNAIEISHILKLCNSYKIPITPRGGGSGVTGGALPVNGGIVLSLERLNKIIEINKVDRYVKVEAGVITADLCHQIEEEGLYFPVIPSSSAFCMVGGNVAENAGSINSCKYGSTIEYVLNLEVVLPTGEIIWTGANVLKNSTGFNLTQLFVGSEGVLGIITKVVYKLLSKPLKEITLLVGFEKLENACNAVVALKESGVVPSAAELICDDALSLVSSHLTEYNSLFENSISTQLLINLQENSEELLTHSLNKIYTLLDPISDGDIYVGETELEKENLWKFRFGIGSALTAGGGKYRDLDICLPQSFLFSYLEKVREICDKYDVKTVRFGHALDGNMHTMLLANKDFEKESEMEVERAAEEIYTFAIECGGVLSGEHGVGMLQKKFMPIQFSEPHLALMKNIKNLFDPNKILNPGKLFCP